jgi:hypothetical protein
VVEIGDKHRRLANVGDRLALALELAGVVEEAPHHEKLLGVGGLPLPLRTCVEITFGYDCAGSGEIVSAYRLAGARDNLRRTH